MTLGRKRRATFLLCSVAFAVLTAPAVARPAHKAAHRHHAAQVAIQSANSGAGQDDRYTVVAAQPAAGEATQRRKHARLTQATPALRGFSSNSLVAEARKYVGTNPTGRGSLWCGAFMDLVLKRTGHAGGGNHTDVAAAATAHHRDGADVRSRHAIAVVRIGAGEVPAAGMAGALED